MASRARQTGAGDAETATTSPSATGEATQAVPNDLRMVAALWPVLLASAVGLVPFTVFSTFLVPIADGTGRSVAAVGGLRGLGGLAAVLVGIALAPVIDRVPKERVAAAGLALLAASAVLGAIGDFAVLAAFCLLTGAATALLNPALTAAAADRFDTGPAAGRAATLVTATQTLTAVLAAPLLALPALLWGWQGDLLGLGLVCVPLAVIVLSWGRRSTQAGGARLDQRPAPGYLASFRALAAVPGAVPLLLVALLRTAAFMGYLAYLAAFYDHRFELDPAVFALVWTLSGASFFVGNLVAGRFTNVAVTRLWPEHVLVLGLLVALLAMAGFYLAPTLPLALLLTSALGISHATVAACVVSLLVRRCGELRGTALSINAAGMSLGVFVGAGLGGAGLALVGYPGVALSLGGLTLVAVGCALVVARSRESATAEPGPQ